ncbi:hypothetical protein [Polymorphum gilvum]|uniref:Uncharacterized protein n=1 Tax=Polymorphum gilvum (strain LMG 25793 / CGMCC 1.9160 / SL003B-26A1) TaxID=991905 RepID=F2IZH7_POLGS|nr:hypothetical protein [Polymorphum gilvum]ADZ68600.1 hypothetical protein SL003B_0161 [Polymorphum gilvum SL003B-26A1]
MATSVDRVLAPSNVVQATEYNDQHRRGHDQGGHGAGSQPSEQKEIPASLDDEPAVVLDTHHTQNPTLDGVAAYRAAAERALGSVPENRRRPAYKAPVNRQPPETVRHAYEDHGGQLEHHAVNLAT